MAYRPRAYRSRANGRSPRKTREAIELERAMFSWGIDCSKNLEQRLFWVESLEHVQNAVRGRVTAPAVQVVVLPVDPVEAILKVVEHDLSVMNPDYPDTMTAIHDALLDVYPDIAIPWAGPFVFDSVTRRYKLKDDIASKNLSPDDDLLDPFKRFTFSRVNKVEQLRKELIDEGSYTHYVHRAILAHHACHHGTCINCKNPTLRANLSKVEDSHYWRQLICTECSSVYQLKSPSKINLSAKCIRGCTFFDQYYNVQRSLPAGAKMYMALIGLQQKESGNGQKVWKVSVAQISNVTPQLKNKSFYASDGERGIYTNVYLVENSHNMWFDIPVFDFDGEALVEQVLQTLC